MIQKATDKPYNFTAYDLVSIIIAIAYGPHIIMTIIEGYGIDWDSNREEAAGILHQIIAEKWVMGEEK